MFSILAEVRVPMKLVCEEKLAFTLGKKDWIDAILL